eukprot:scaffold19645_cov140-Isochrysis_galbana.AAC.3
MVFGRLLAQAAQMYIRDILVASPRFRAWARQTDQTLQQAPDVLQHELKRRLHRAREQISGAGAASAQTSAGAAGATGARARDSGKSSASASDFASRASAFASALREEIKKDLGGAASAPSAGRKR